MQVAFHTGFLGGVEVTEAVRMIRDHGYDAAELNGETLPWAAPHVTPETPANVRRELAALGPYTALSAHHANLASPDREARRAARNWTVAMLDLAVDVDVSFVHVIPGANGVLGELEESLSDVLAHAETRGLRLGLEPIVNQAVAGKEQLLPILEQLPTLDVNLDPSHLQVTDGDVVEITRRVVDRVAHVAIKDAAGTSADWSFPRLGQGEVDFVGMLQVLFEAGYQGAVSVEHESHVFGNDDRSVSEVLRDSRRFVSDIVGVATHTDG